MRTIKCRDYVNYDPEKLHDDVRNINWQSVYQSTNVNRALEYFTEKLREVFDRHAPIIKKRVKGRKCNWLNRDIKSQMNRRDQLLRKARRSKSDYDWNEYKRLRNRCNNDIK